MKKGRYFLRLIADRFIHRVFSYHFGISKAYRVGLGSSCLPLSPSRKNAAVSYYEDAPLSDTEKGQHFLCFLVL